MLIAGQKARYAKPNPIVRTISIGRSFTSPPCRQLSKPQDDPPQAMAKSIAFISVRSSVKTKRSPQENSHDDRVTIRKDRPN
jgi:hypothetical protein